MFDLPKVLPFEVLSLTKRFLSTAISLALVIAPFSSSIANELQYSTGGESGKPEKIVDHFGDGSNFGVKLNYVTEDRY